jgi:hypothetical protein
MSSSEVIFREKSRTLKDSALGRFLDILEEEIQENYCESDHEWVKKACMVWQDVWGEMPPGLRDIEFDEFLIDSHRQLLFCELVSSILEKVKDFPEGADFLAREITKIQELLA